MMRIKFLTRLLHSDIETDGADTKFGQIKQIPEWIFWRPLFNRSWLNATMSQLSEMTCQGHQSFCPETHKIKNCNKYLLRVYFIAINGHEKQTLIFREELGERRQSNEKTKNDTRIGIQRTIMKWTKIWPGEPSGLFSKSLLLVQ